MINGTYYNMYWNSSLYDSNVKIIHDVCQPDGTLKSKRQLENDYDIHLNVLEYNSLVSDIPKDWKKCLKHKTLIKKQWAAMKKLF